MNRAYRTPPTALLRLAALIGGALIGAALLGPIAACAAPPGQALVVGEASYTGFPPISGCALSGHSVAAALRRLGFSVVEQTDASSGAIFAGIAELTRHLKTNPDSPVMVYVCSYVTSFDGRPFLLPVSAAISRPADVLTQGLLMKTLVDAVRSNTKAPAVIAVDGITLPNAAGSLGLDRLTADLPSSLGLIAVRDSVQNDQPTRFAAMLVPALRGPVVQSAGLLADLKPQLAGERTVTIEALHVPQHGQDLAAASSTVPPAAVPPVAVPSAAASPATPRTPAVVPAGVPAASAPPGIATSLPAEDQMADADRRVVQQALTKLGYYDGGIDGIFGPETRAAIRRWQHEVHLPMTGRLDATEATRLAGG